MRITKVWLRQAKTRIQYRIKEIFAIHQCGGEEAIKREFARIFPYRSAEMYPTTANEMMREMINHYIDHCIPNIVVD